MDALTTALGAAAPSASVTSAYVWSGEELEHVTSGMRAAVRTAAAELAELGMAVAPLPVGLDIRQLAADHLLVMAYEVAHERPDLVQRRAEVSPQLAALVEDGLRVRGEDYRAAMTRTGAAAVQVADLLGDGGVIVGPGAPGPAPAGLSATGSPVMSRPWQLLGLPQLCVPGVETRRGRPLGVQLVGAPHAERALISLGARWGEHRGPEIGRAHV